MKLLALVLRVCMAALFSVKLLQDLMRRPLDTALAFGMVLAIVVLGYFMLRRQDDHAAQ